MDEAGLFYSECGFDGCCDGLVYGDAVSGDGRECSFAAIFQNACDLHADCMDVYAALDPYQTGSMHHDCMLAKH